MALQDPETVPHLLQQLADEGMTDVDMQRLMGLRNSHQIGRWRNFERPQLPTTPAMLQALWRLCEVRGLDEDSFVEMITKTYVVRARYDARYNLRAAGLVQV